MTELTIKNMESDNTATLENAKASSPKPRSRPPARVLRLLLIPTAVALIAVITCVAVYLADQSLRANLLQQTRLVAQAVEVKHVQALSGTQADLDSQDYRRLKEQLAAVRSANVHCRFLYILGRKPDGKVFFFVDSEPTDSKDYSPPGQLFDESSAELLQMFATQVAFVEGPVTDSWGTWISALVPMTDPQTGAVVAVLGMDVDVRLWKWEVAARVALPLGLLLVILIGVVSVRLSTRAAGRDGTGRPGKLEPKPVLRRLMPPLASMVILLLTGTGALLYWQHRQQMAKDTAAVTADVSQKLDSALKQMTSVLTVAAQTIATDTTAQTALRERDNSERLLAFWQPVFEALRREKHISHFYFLDNRRVCLLRLHKPEDRGDRIGHFTALEAERTGKSASGLELGSMGTCALRTVQPVYAGGTLVGYVELGMEIEDTLQEIHLGPSVRLAVSLRKQFLNRQTWEEGMRMLGKDSDWNRLPRGVLIYSSHGRLPEVFAPMADHDESGRHADGKPDRQLTFVGRNWRISTLPLRDASGIEIGDISIMCDISDDQATFARLVILGGTFGGVLLALLLGFVYVLLRQTDRRIRSQELELRESEQSYHNQFANNSAVMLLIDPSDGAIIDANTAAVFFYDYPRERLLTMRITDINTLPAAEALRTMAAVHADFGQRHRAQHRLADGSVRQVEMALSLIPFGGRNVLHAIVQDITEQKRAEETLRENHDMIVKLTAQVPGTVYQYRLYPDGRSCFPFASQGMEAIYEVTPEEVRMDAAPAFRRLHPEDHDRIVAAIHESARSLQPFSCEFRVVLPGQGLRWRLSDALPERTADGGTLWHGVISDITERKQVEAYRDLGLDILKILNEPGSLPDSIRRVLDVLKEHVGFDAVGLRLQDGEDFPYFAQQGFSEDFLLTENTLAERGADGGVCRDKDGMVCLECTCGLVISGKTAPAHPFFTRAGSFWTNDFAPLLDLPSDKDPRLNPRNQCIRHGYASMALIPVRDKEHIIGLLHLSDRRKGCFTLATIALLEGLAAHIGTALTRKCAEAEVQRSAEQNRTILKTAMDGFWLVDSQERLEEVNDAYCRRSGYSKPELLAMKIADLSVKTADEISANQKRIAEHGRGERFESKHRRKDGSLFDVEVCVQYQPESQKFVIFIHDITERKRSEAELLKMQKLQSVGTLAGGIAHDFNNILLGLFGNISIAMDDLPKEHPSYAPLEEAEKSMSRAVRLTKQLLTFAKGGAPVKENVGLGELVEEVASFDLTGSNVSLVYHAAENLWPVDADKGQIQQVVSNIVINARQAMPNGGHMTITLENADLPAEAVPTLRQGRYVKISMQDEGDGINPKVLFQIFDPYFTTKQTGNGLGLATVWSIVSKHNGHIGVESELGKGTTLTLYLPASASPQSAEAKPPASGCPQPARAAKILVMDDEEVVCALAARMLTRCGHTVATVPGGQEATALYKQALEGGAPFDAVIMDLTIPGGPGGKEVVKSLLALDPKVRALVSSGYADDPVMANPVAYGFKGTAAKPYTANALREAVARLLA